MEGFVGGVVEKGRGSLKHLDYVKLDFSKENTGVRFQEAWRDAFEAGVTEQKV